jgi:hypothetical protein
MPSHARTLGSWVPVPLKTWPSVCVKQRPCVGLISRLRNPTDCVRRNWSETKCSTDAPSGSNRNTSRTRRRSTLHTLLISIKRGLMTAQYPAYRTELHWSGLWKGGEFLTVKPNKLTLLTCIRKCPSSTLGRGTYYSKVLRGLLCPSKQIPGYHMTASIDAIAQLPGFRPVDPVSLLTSLNWLQIKSNKLNR